MSRLSIALIAFAAAAPLVFAQAPRKIDDLALRNAVKNPSEWVSYGATPGETRYSALDQINAEEVRLTVLHEAAGDITDNDILLASASNAIVVGFNTRITDTARRAAEAELFLGHCLCELVREQLAGLGETWHSLAETTPVAEEDVLEGHEVGPVTEALERITQRF